MKTALISGITGQDGSFLAEFLLQKGYEVHGILRRSSSFNTGRIEHLYFDEWVRDMKQKRTINLHYGDMTDSSSLIRIIQQVQPDEIYNLAAQSHVKVSFDVPEYTAEADAIGTLRMLEAVRILGMEKKTKIYQASTSELYGKVQEVPQSETTPFYPRSPYGVAKQYGFWITKMPPGSVRRRSAPTPGRSQSGRRRWMRSQPTAAAPELTLTIKRQTRRTPRHITAPLGRRSGRIQKAMWIFWSAWRAPAARVLAQQVICAAATRICKWFWCSPIRTPA